MKKKALTVTVILGIMFLLILFGLAYLWDLGFTILVALLAAAGVRCLTLRFYHWLSTEDKRVDNKEDKPEELPTVEAEAYDLDSIIEETKGCKDEAVVE